MGRREVESVLKASRAFLDHLDLKESEDHKVYRAPQAHRDSQALAEAAAHRDLPVSPEIEVLRETPALQASPSQAHQDVPDLPVLPAHRGSPDLQASPPPDKPACLARPAAPDRLEIEVTQERPARKVRRVTPV